MLWFILALGSAFFAATYSVMIKKLVKNVDEYSLGASTLLIGAFFLLIISLAKGIPKLNSTFFYAILIISVINAAALIFHYKALKIADISVVEPFISFTPLFLILTSYIILGEQPSLQGVAGIFLIVFGAYLMNFKKSRNIFKPFRECFRNKGIFLVLCTAFLWSISVNFEKIAIINSDALFATFSIFLFIGCILLFISVFRNHSFKHVRMICMKNFKWLLFAACLSVLTDISLAFALTQQIVPYVISIKRTSILFSVLYGMIVFREKAILPRFFSALLMFAGILLIILF